jgi:hypothetical protein
METEIDREEAHGRNAESRKPRDMSKRDNFAAQA